MTQPASKSLNPPIRRSNQGGMALFVTIVLVTLAAVILAGITYRHELDKTRTARALISEQAILLSISAESWAKSILRQDAEDNDTDSFDDDWAQVIPVLPVENGLMTGCIVDMQSMYNLNSLVGFNDESFLNASLDDVADQIGAYLRLRELVGLVATEDYAATIIDWIDTDSELVAPGSAEDSEYSLEDPARLAANAPLTSIGELVSVYGYSLADVIALDQFATALPVPTTLNVNTADILVLMAFSPLIDEYVAEGVIENMPYESLDDFYTALEEQIGVMSLEDVKRQLPSELISVDSDFFELRAQVSLVDETIALRSLFQRRGRNEVRTISRSFEYIPDLELDEDDENPIPPLCNQNRDEESEEDIS